MNRSAWLIGAGFSYELGMPLVWELTDEIKRWLTPEHLRELAAGWQARGRGMPIEIIDAFAERLTRQDEHYEQLIGWLQAEQYRCRSNAAQSAHYHALVGMLQDVVGRILLERHTRNPEYHRHSLPWYRGLAHAVPAADPLWVFSLNHDLHVEMLAIELGIPLSCGFAELNAVGFTGDDGRRVFFDRITRDRLAKHQLDYPTAQRAINLVKLHGSLDVFAYNDLLDYLRVHPEHDTVDGWIRAMQAVEQHLPAKNNGQPIPVQGEICVYDDAHELQFLRRTPVAGAFKFEGRASYNAPGELVEFFANKLNEFEELVVIGYSWGDRHLNGPIEKWLAADPDRRIVNVDPKGLPAHADHIRSRVDVRAVGAAEYLASFDSSPIDPAAKQLRDLRLQVRRLNGSKTRFQETMGKVMKQRVAEVVAWIARQNLSGNEDPAALVDRLATEVGFDQQVVLAQLITELRTLAK